MRSANFGLLGRFRDLEQLVEVDIAVNMLFEVVRSHIDGAALAVVPLKFTFILEMEIQGVA